MRILEVTAQTHLNKGKEFFAFHFHSIDLREIPFCEQQIVYELPGDEKPIPYQLIKKYTAQRNLGPTWYLVTRLSHLVPANSSQAPKPRPWSPAAGAWHMVPITVKLLAMPSGELSAWNCNLPGGRGTMDNGPSPCDPVNELLAVPLCHGPYLGKVLKAASRC